MLRIDAFLINLVCALVSMVLEKTLGIADRAEPDFRGPEFSLF